MEKDVLSQVIDVEKEIQKDLDSEKVKAREWLEAAKRQEEQSFLVEQQRIQQSLDQSLAEAVKQAGEKAERIVHQTELAAERLGHLNAEVLGSIVERRISRILPG